jgi:hypothetical protein
VCVCVRVCVCVCMCVCVYVCVCARGVRCARGVGEQVTAAVTHLSDEQFTNIGWDSVYLGCFGCGLFWPTLSD